MNISIVHSIIMEGSVLQIFGIEPESFYLDNLPKVFVMNS